MSSQYGELRPTNGWDRFTSLGHPYKFQRVSRLGSITARHSSCGRQPNFAAVNRRRHLYLAGRQSRWALAHISSLHLCSFFIIRPHHSTMYVAAAYCYRLSSTVCRSVCHNVMSCGWTDRTTIWVVDSDGLKKWCIRWRYRCIIQSTLTTCSCWQLLIIAWLLQ